MREHPVTAVAGFVVGLVLTPVPWLVLAAVRADDDARLWVAKGVKAAVLRLARPGPAAAG